MVFRRPAWFPRLRPRRQQFKQRLRLESLENRTLLSASPLELAVNPVPANVTDGTLLSTDEVDTYSFTVSGALGSGSLTTNVIGTTGDLIPRLTLSGPQGELLIQSDGGRIVQHLQPGTYSVSVSAQVGLGDYQLTTGFTVAGPPLSPLVTGGLPRSVAVGDFNRDGVPDIVVPNFRSNDISLLLGNGDATFQPQRLIVTGSGPISVTVADVNGDGNPDVLAPNRGTDTLGLLLGNGDGSFQPMAAFAVGNRPGGVAAADMNGDGKFDLAVSNYDESTVSVLLGNGDGTFQPQQKFGTDLGPGKVETADVDGDGVFDLITANYISGSVSVLLGLGDGTFAPQQPFAAGSSPYSSKVADVNGDGQPDIAVTNYRDNSVSVLLGIGDGTFQPQQSFAAGTGAYSLSTADVNGDGHVDLLTANFSDNSVGVLLGLGDGTFSESKDFAAGKGTGGVAAVDVDGDGRPDLVTANFTDNNVSVLLGRGDGTFAAQQAAPSPAPDMRLYSVEAADLNGDGRPDIVTSNKNDSTVSVLLGNPDGSFQTKQTFPTGTTPNVATIADVSGDGIPDIVTASYTESSASVLLGNGDGTFATARNFATGGTAYNMTLADVNGDGSPDIVTANNNVTVSVLLNNRDGTFQPQRSFATGGGTISVAVADVNGDHLPDLATANFNDNTVSLLLGNGDGTFQDQQVFSVGRAPGWVILDDINGDSQTDLVVTNGSGGTVSVLLGNGDGSFQPTQEFPAGDLPRNTKLDDFNGDDIPDLVTANVADSNGNLLVGNGDGTFQAPRVFSLGVDAAGMAVSDFNADGRRDLVASNFRTDSVLFVLGNGDGTFRPVETLTLGKSRYSVAVADVNGDGKPDVVKTNLRQNSLSVELGTGSGSFDPGLTVEVGPQPTSVRVADFNADGRLDLVTTNSDADSVSVALGNGDGTFNAQQTFDVGRSPREVAIADINGDGWPDLAVTNYNDGTVSVLLGWGDGSFGTQQKLLVGQRPYSLSAADVDGDDQPDLVAGNSVDNTVSVLRGNGDGTFQAQQMFATGRQPFAVTIADVNGDDLLDVVTANTLDNSISVLLGNGDGSFQTQTVIGAGNQPSSIDARDINGDGKTDLVTANFTDDNASVLFGNGGGSFQTPQTHVTNVFPVQTVVSDINGDGRPDLVTVANHDNSTVVLLSTGGGEFRPASAATDVGLRNTPLLADLNGDGAVDRVVLDRSGRILFRQGLPSSNLIFQSPTFAPPVILNPAHPAREITILRTGSELVIAAADSRFDPDLSTSQFVFTVSVYRVDSNGAVSRHTAFSTTAPPSRLVAADLTGDGLADLIAANPLDNSVTVALRNATGDFLAPITVPSGNAPSDIAVADVNSDGRPDVLVSSQASGDVSVVLNDAALVFNQTLRFRAGTQPYGLDMSSDSPLVSSLAESVSLVSGDFTGDGSNDVVVVNRGAHSVTVLPGNGRGGFANPQVSLTTSTSDGFNINERPGATVAGDFNRDGDLDVAVLMQDTGQLWIFTGNGAGIFHHTFTIAAGDQATGLSVVPGSGDGHLDLLVGNGFGDVLHLAGKGDGTFQIRGNRVSLSVVPDLFGPGQAGVLVGNQQDNRVTVQAQTSGGSGFSAVETLGADNESQLAPGDVQWSLLARNATLPDAVVVSTGGNAVIVYHTLSVSNGTPVFSSTPHTYFVGTAPTSVTVADINGDAIPDMLVANRGSNDVSVLFGTYATNGEWLGNVGPRLRSGGAGPIAVAVRDLNGDLIPDLALTNGGSGTITMLAGVGQGFFDDQQPQMLFDLGGAVDQPPTFRGDSSLGFAVTSAGNLVQFDLSNPAAGADVVFSGSQLVAARALSSGQVVVAVADGTVKILSPQGDRLIVTSELRAQASAPALPSSLVVLQQASGQFQVLVSSQGSDTVSVFASVSVGLPSVTLLIPSQAISSQPSSAGLPNSLLTISTLLSLNSMTDSLGGTIGLSLASFLSTNSLVFSTASAAALVSVEGNSYSTVAVLDFGSQQDDESGDGRGRRPELSTRFPFGSTSPLTRFVIGIEEAILEFAEDVLLPEDGEAPLNDPWNADLFHPRKPKRPPTRDTKQEPPTEAPKTEAPSEGEAPQTKQSRLQQDSVPDEQAMFDSFWEQFSDEDLWLTPSFAARGRSELAMENRRAGGVSPLVVCREPFDQGTNASRSPTQLFLPAYVVAGLLVTQVPRSGAAKHSDDEHSELPSRESPR
jgi:hypothetical protein